MKLYGYFQNEFIDDGFLMPVFQEGESLFFQRIHKDSSITYEKLDLENDTYDPIHKYECYENLDYNKRIYVFKDENSICVGSAKKILNKAKSFSCYKEYEDSFEELKKNYQKEIEKEYGTFDSDKLIAVVMSDRYAKMYKEMCARRANCIFSEGLGTPVRPKSSKLPFGMGVKSYNPRTAFRSATQAQAALKASTKAHKQFKKYLAKQERLQKKNIENVDLIEAKAYAK